MLLLDRNVQQEIKPYTISRYNTYIQIFNSFETNYKSLYILLLDRNIQQEIKPYTTPRYKLQKFEFK